MDTVGEVSISLTPILAIVAIVAGLAAYRLQRRMALAPTMIS